MKEVLCYVPPPPPPNLERFDTYIVAALGGPPSEPTWGHMNHLNKFEFPTPMDDSCQLWFKSDHAFSRR